MMGRLRQAIHGLLKIFRDTRGINTMDVVLATAVSITLAAVAVPYVMDQVERGKVAKAIQETNSIMDAMSRFFRDTGKWPAEVEIRRAGRTTCFLQAGVPATDPNQGTLLPEVGTQGLGIDASQFIGRSCNSLTVSAMVNINDYLHNKPSESDYPGWNGPYVSPVASDPFDRGYLINVLPLIFTTDIPDPGSGASADTGGKLGRGWVISAGPDRLLQTRLNAAEQSSDDIGGNLGARVSKSVGAGSGTSGTKTQ